MTEGPTWKWARDLETGDLILTADGPRAIEVDHEGRSVRVRYQGSNGEVTVTLGTQNQVRVP